MLDGAGWRDLILWDWPIPLIVTVGFYALAAAGALRLLRLVLSLAVRGYYLIATGRAVDYSELRHTRHQSGRFAGDHDWDALPKWKRIWLSLWEMLTWWITGYSQKQSVTKVALTNLSSRSGIGAQRQEGPHATVKREPNFGPALPERPPDDPADDKEQ